MLKEIKTILKEKDFKKLKILLSLNSLTFFFEFLSISSIPIFVTVLINPQLILKQNFRIRFFIFS